MSSSTRTDHLLGREDELATIDRLLAATARGTGGAVLFEGRPGLGKTALLREARLAAQARGLPVLSARAGELERGWGFGLARALLEPAIAKLDASERLTVLSGAAQSAVAVIDPDVAVTAAPGDEQGVTYGLSWLVTNLAGHGPLVAVVDDLQWSDAASLGWLAHLIRRLEDMPVGLVLAARAADHEELASLRADPGVDRIDLQPLSAPAVAHLVRRTVPDGDEELCESCALATGGNPFLVEEWLRARAAGTLDASGEFTTREAAASVLARLGRLPAASRSVAEAVGVLGAQAEPGHVAALADLPTDDAATEADRLISAGVVHPARPLRFLHPLIDAAVRADMLPGRRSTLHSRAARLLETHGASADRVALHLLETDPCGDPWTVQRLRAAAALARARGAPREARRLLERALHEPPPVDQRGEVRLEAARASLAATDMRALDELRGVLSDEQAPARIRVAAAHELASALWYFDAAGAKEAFDAALVLLGDDPEQSLRKRLEGERVLLNCWAAGTPLESARTEVEALAHDAVEAPVATHLARAWLQESAPRAREHARRALSGVAAIRLTTPLIEPAVVNALIWAEDYDVALEAADDLMDHARTRGLVHAFVTACNLRAAVHLRRGALTDAEAELRAAIVEGPLADYFITWATLALVLTEQGQPDAAAAAIDRLSVTPEQLQGWPRAVVAFARGSTELTNGNSQAALAAFRLAGDTVDSSLGPVAPTCLLRPWRAAAADALMATGDQAGAAALALEGLDQARRTEAPRAIGVALITAGLASRDRTLLEDAVRVLDDSEAKLELARALWALGSDLRRSGERRAAREPLRRAVEFAHRCGAETLAAHAHEDLLATGARPRRVALSGVASLTPSERRVAQLAATGLSNPEIAQTLFITRKTVEKHVGEIFRKLDLRSRTEIAHTLATESE